jgi:transposase-like protein
VIRLWRDAWEEFIPFLSFPSEIRSMIYTTNAIESLNARFRRATRITGHFPNETSAPKVLYLTIKTRELRGGNAIGRVRNWKRVLNHPASPLRRQDQQSPMNITRLLKNI